MNDLDIRQYEQGIYDAINNGQLPLEIKRLILENIYMKVSNETDKHIHELIDQQNKEENVNAEDLQ